MRVGALKLKLQLVCGQAYAMGPGKADILDAIAREGSISAAGRALGMSYRRTWLLVDEMNRCFRDPLVDARAGGGRERGAHLTEAGRAVLAAYRDLGETGGRDHGKPGLCGADRDGAGPAAGVIHPVRAGPVEALPLLRHEEGQPFDKLGASREDSRSISSTDR